MNAVAIETTELLGSTKRHTPPRLEKVDIDQVGDAGFGLQYTEDLFFNKASSWTCVFLIIATPAAQLILFLSGNFRAMDICLCNYKIGSRRLSKDTL